jgi:hypothetical protein
LPPAPLASRRRQQLRVGGGRNGCRLGWRGIRAGW